MSGATLIDDTYNANPESMRAAIDVLAKSDGSTVLVLGDMGELGSAAPALHAELGTYAKKAGIQRLLAIGENAARTAEAFGSDARHYSSVDDVVRDLRPLLSPDATVLVKGSRFMRMERVVDAVALDGQVPRSSAEKERH